VTGHIQRLFKIFLMLREEARLAAVPLPRLVLDVLVFCSRTRLGPRYFVVAGMARRGFPAQAKWRHISASSYYSALDILNPLAYRKLTQNKLAEKALYQVLNIPTATLLGFYQPYSGVAAGEPLKTVEQFEVFLATLEGEQVCIKPVEGWGGAGVKVGQIVIDSDGPQFCTLPSGARLSAAQLIASYTSRDMSCAGFVVEAFLTQSPEFATFNPSSLNTLRLWVLERAPGQSEVIGAYLRVGRVGKAIDNASAGGVMCPVELESGILQPGLTKHTPHRDEILRHPDHDAQLAGHQLSNWSEIVRFSCDVVTRLPHVRFAGLDVTVTALGPILVETNVAPDKDGAAHANIPSVELKKAANTTYV